MTSCPGCSLRAGGRRRGIKHDHGCLRCTQGPRPSPGAPSSQSRPRFSITPRPPFPSACSSGAAVPPLAPLPPPPAPHPSPRPGPGALVRYGRSRLRMRRARRGWVVPGWVLTAEPGGVTASGVTAFSTRAPRRAQGWAWPRGRCSRFLHPGAEGHDRPRIHCIR